MAIGRLGAKGARLGAFVLSGHRPPAVAPVIVVAMRASAGPVYRVSFNGQGLVYLVYANGVYDTAFNNVAGPAEWTNPRTALNIGSTPQPGDNRSPNVLGSNLLPGPDGISAAAVYFDDAGNVKGVQFNGPSNVQVTNADGSIVQASNALPSGSPARWANQ